MILNKNWNNNKAKKLLNLKNIIILLGILLLAIILYRSIFTAYEQPKKEAVDETVTVLVETFNAKPKTKTLNLRGQTEANRTLNLKAETAGTIVFIEERKGISLDQGTLIAKIADDNRDERLEQAKALVEQRKLEFEAATKLTKESFKSEVNLAQQKSLLKDAEANLASIEVDLERTFVKAPFDCVLYERYVELGDYVKVADRIASIADLSPLLVTADASEADVNLIQEGAPARAILSGGTQVDGKIIYIGSIANDETRTFRIEMEVPNADHKIKDGLTADLFIPVESVNAHLISPAIISLNDEGVPGVKSVDNENRVVFYPITLLSQESNGIWVSGLPDEVKLITVGQDFYAPGQTVKVVKK